ncbi:UV-endonuclease UvdE, partial [Aureobasidium melanogenum]
MAKRKRSSAAGADAEVLTPKTLPTNVAPTASSMMPPAPAPAQAAGRRISTRRASQVFPANIDTNPNTNEKIEDGPDALRASPDAEQAGPDSRASKKRRTAASVVKVKVEPEGSQPDARVATPAKPKSAAKAAATKQVDGLDRGDPEAEDEEDANPEELQEALSRPPPVNSSYLPLPWKGRLGHDVYGYTLAPFASETLAEAGRVAAELGHRLTTHPGQFTQLGSPRQEVIRASIRDLEYHCELLDLLKLPEQQNRDAVMILHMGGVFGDKDATIARFKENYAKLPQGIKDRLVLENDDVCYSVHDLLPVCEELNIPLVLDFHHHNIVFDSDKIREGTRDIMDLYDRIKATWTRKGITQKMHYSEPVPSAITARQRRKHNPRVATLPPCAPDMDLMIEAKDKEQAVFELMRTFKLPGFDTFNDMVPHVRHDENRPWKAPKKPKKPSKKKSKSHDEELLEDEEDGETVVQEAQPPPIIPDSEVGMGGPEGRVYWPPGMEEWLRPKKREVKPRDPEKAKTTAERAALRRAEKAAWQAAQEAAAAGGGVGVGGSASVSEGADSHAPTPKAAKAIDHAAAKSVYDVPKGKKPARAPRSRPATTTTRGKKGVKSASVPTPSTSDLSSELDDSDLSSGEGTDGRGTMPDLTDTEEVDVDVDLAPSAKTKTNSKRQVPTRTVSGRSAKRKPVNYAELEADMDDEV